MDTAAAWGELDALTYLHTQGGHGGCTKTAMDKAAQMCHLDIVQFLHENRSEGCTTAAMDKAVSRGHLDIVQFLHENRSEGCTPIAMDYACSNGDLNIVQFLHFNRSEGGTAMALNSAASNGHLDVVKFLRAHRPNESCVAAAIKHARHDNQNTVPKYLCGQLNTICFDKTGTLTEESLELVDIDVVSESKASFDRVSFEKLPEEFRMAMATCHRLSEVDGELHGYSLELSMFQKAQVTLQFMEYLAIATQSETTFHEKFGIVKRFHFDAACQRSSLIVENVETEQRHIFVKGSPEAIRAIAVDTPSDFKQKSHRYAAEGFYCIDFGMRNRAPGKTIDTDSREAVEKDVAFMGITLFHNELKPESQGMIKELDDAAIDVRMITGDNALTAVHVARLLSMELKSKVAIVDLNESSEVVFHCVDQVAACDGAVRLGDDRRRAGAT